MQKRKEKKKEAKPLGEPPGHERVRQVVTGMRIKWKN